MKNPRVRFALSAPAVAAPFQLLQAIVLMHLGALALHDWQALLIANLVLLAAVCALAAEVPLADRLGRAVLVGVGVPLLIPGPTALDSVVMLAAPGWDAGTWLVILMPYVLLLGMLALAEAGLYLLATRARTTPR